MKKCRIFAITMVFAMLLSMTAFASSDDPGGELYTLTVNGVETAYAGGDEIPADGVVTGTETYSVNGYENPYRAALYIENGIVPERSVTAAISGGSRDDEALTGASICSEAESFNGVILAAGAYTIKDSDFAMRGTGGNDAQGVGAAIWATGDAELTLDGVTVDNAGVVRSSLVVDGDAKVLVKNSRLSTSDGTQAEGYVGALGTGAFISVPWMLGLDGNARSINLMENGAVTYVDSILTAEKWGVLSFDDNTVTTNAVVIDSTVAITGGLTGEWESGLTAEQLESFDIYEDEYKDSADVRLTSDGKPSGYGTIIMGDMLGVFAGAQVIVPSYACIMANQGGTIVYTSSEKEGLENLTDTLSALGSTYIQANPDYEVYALDKAYEAEPEEKNTVVYSERVGIMSYDDARAFENAVCGTILINDGTEFYTGDTSMVIKGFPVNIFVDDAKLVSGSGTLLQVVDCDDPGLGENMTFTGRLEEPTSASEDTRVRTRTMDELNDLTPSESTMDGDHLVTANFSNMEALSGNMYNSSGTNETYNAGAPILNMYVVLDSIGQYDGVISASRAFHSRYTYTYTDDEGQEIGVIMPTDWYDEFQDETWFAENGWKETDNSWHYLLSDYMDYACPSADNGVIVELKNGTVWKVTGDSYLTKLIVGEGCTVNGVMTVDGVETDIEPGEYEGDIVVTPDSGSDDLISVVVQDGELYLNLQDLEKTLKK